MYSSSGDSDSYQSPDVMRHQYGVAKAAAPSKKGGKRKKVEKSLQVAKRHTVVLKGLDKSMGSSTTAGNMRKECIFKLGSLYTALREILHEVSSLKKLGKTNMKLSAKAVRAIEAYLCHKILKLLETAAIANEGTSATMNEFALKKAFSILKINNNLRGYAEAEAEFLTSHLDAKKPPTKDELAELEMQKEEEFDEDKGSDKSTKYVYRLFVPSVLLDLYARTGITRSSTKQVRRVLTSYTTEILGTLLFSAIDSARVDKRTVILIRDIAIVAGDEVRLLGFDGMEPRRKRIKKEEIK